MRIRIARGLGCLLVALAIQCFDVSAQERPNVVLILADDLGYGDLSSYGAKDIQSPHIDQLVTDGMRFDHFYANCPVCSPTRASILSGRFPDMVGVPGVIRTHRRNNWGFLNPSTILLPKILKGGGYSTALIGKWHLGMTSPNLPNDHGFDFFHGWLGDMMDDYYTHRRHDINYMRKDRDVIDPEGHATDLFTDWAIEYIEKQSATPEPFFLFLSYNAPHSPIQPPPDWLAKVREREPQASLKRAKLIALIEHMDDGIGRVRKAIDDAGISKDTLIIFTSDNGGSLRHGATNGALRAGKGDMYEGGIRVPAAAVWPGKIEAGVSSTQRAMTMDLYTTIAEVAGASVPEGLEAKSFLPALQGTPEANAERLLVWVRREGGGYGGNAYYAVRKGPWKLVQNSPYEGFQLFNLADDPLEERPLPESHARFKELFSDLRMHINRAGAVAWQEN